MASKSFCILPWMHLATTSTGNLRVCCNSTPGANVPKDANGRPFRMDRAGDIERFVTSTTMKTIRRQMLDGDEPDICSRCFREEAVGIRSARIAYNEQFSDLIGAVVDESPLAPRYLDLRFGNLCNLKCRMCNPYSSNQLVDEWNALNPDEALDDREIARLSLVDWSSSSAPWDELAGHLDGIDMIYLTGGEPTLSPGMFKLLDLCIERGIAERITLKFNTNATNVPDRLVALWPRFRRVLLNLSIDAYGDLNRYIRYPSNWTAISKNIAKIDALCGDVVQAEIHTTVQILNVTKLTELFDYCLGFKAIRRFPYLNILDHPHYHNIQALPLELKQKSADTLRLWDRNNDSGDQYQKKIDHVLDYMFASDRPDDFSEFVRKTEVLDRTRGQNLVDVLPGFIEAIQTR